MKKIILLISILHTLTTFSQNSFEWVTAGQSMSMDYLVLEAHPDGGVVALAEKSQLNYITDEVRFVQGDGSDYTGWSLMSNSNVDILLYFDDKGRIQWLKAVRSDYVRISSVTTGKDGVIYVVAYVEEYDEDSNGNIIGYLGELNDSPNEAIPYGYKILTYNVKGQIQSIIPLQNIEESADIEVTNFALAPNGQYILSGFMENGKIASNLKTEALNGGGEFVIAIDKEGMPIWADVVSQRRNSCCSQTSEGSSLDVAPDGTVYLAGTYFTGGVFSNGLETMAPGKFTGNRNNAREAYVVSYSPKGKINWVKTDESSSTMHKMVATEDGVFLAHVISGPKSFGTKVDTIGMRSTVFTFINTRGKVKWNEVSAAYSVQDIGVNSKGEVVVAGLFKKIMSSYDTPGHFGKFTMKEREELFIVTLDTKGNFINLWSDHLLTSSDPIHFAIGPNDEMFLSLEIWCTLSLELGMIDKSFPNLKCSGGTPFLGKINPNSGE